VGRVLGVTVLLGGLVFPAPAERILVAPFHRVSGPVQLDWVGEGLAEGIREVLAGQGWEAVPREERDEAARTLGLGTPVGLSLASWLKLAIEVEASHLVWGEFEVLAAGESPHEASLRVSVRLIEGGRFTGAGPFEERGSVAELSRISAGLGRKILCQLPDGACGPEDGLRDPFPDVRTEALEQYILGLTSPAPEVKHRHFAQAALLAPEFSAPRFEMGKLYWSERAYRDAARWLERVAPTDWRYRGATFLLGLARYHMGDYSGAAEAFSRLARLAPSPPVWNNLGVALLRSGDPAAFETLRQALEADPADPDYQFNAGYILWRQGDLAGARERFAAALALAPGDETAQEMLERCRQNSGPRRGDLSTEGLERLKEQLGQRLSRPLDFSRAKP
jgi:Flp pilus assembly protein TadD